MPQVRTVSLDSTDFTTKEDKAGSGGVNVKFVRKGESVQFIPLTKNSGVADTHWVSDHDGNPRQIACNGDNCVCCRVGKAVTETLLIPGYDLEDEIYSLVSVPNSKGLKSVGHQLKKLLKKIEEEEDSENSKKGFSVIEIRRVNNISFEVSKTLIGEKAIDQNSLNEAKEMAEAGELGFDQAVTVLSNDEIIEEFPKVARKVVVYAEEITE